MKFHSVSIFIWCLVGIDTAVLRLQRPHTLYSQCSRVIGATTPDKEWVRCGERDIGSIGTNQISDIRLVRSGQTAEAGNGIPCEGSNEAIAGKDDVT